VSTPGPPRIEVPVELEAQRRLGAGWGDWLDALPARATGLLEEWSLRVAGPSLHGAGSLVLPVVAEDAGPAMLKIAYDGTDETEHEALALQHWGGRGAVRLLRADPRRRSLLLERLEATDLTTLWDLDACEVVAGLYGALDVPAPPQLRTVASYVEEWVAAMVASGHDLPIPRRLVDQTVALARDLTAPRSERDVLVHHDLHYENVLAADREPWLVIDPQPKAGERAYELEPMLRNRWDELYGHGSVREGVRQRFFALVDGAGLDEDRARAWVVVRSVLNAHWSVEDARRGSRALDDQEREHVTRCITIAKAVQE